MFLIDKSFWEIKSSAKKGRGVYARKNILPGIVIGDYIGKVIKTAIEDTSEKNGLYLLYYHDYASIYPEDITAPGVHLLNHSCQPNCWVYTYKGHTLFFTLRHIFAGEELTISYQLSPDDYCNPCTHACHCQSSDCKGTMHLSKTEFLQWNQFQEKQSLKTKRAKIHYGKLLPKLKEYPEKIIDHTIYTLYGSAKHEAQPNEDAILPSIKELRKRIRQTGKKLIFPKLKKTIVGIKNNTIITA